MFEFLFISLWNVLIIETTTVLSDTYIYCNRVGAGGQLHEDFMKKNHQKYIQSPLSKSPPLSCSCVDFQVQAISASFALLLCMW